jgi:autotransporter translocation and assembly factor TamB
MATAKKSIAKKSRRIVRWLLVAVVVLLAGIYALRSVIIAPYAIAFLERTVAADLGLQISIGHLGGTYFSSLEVKNVKTVKRLDDGPLTDVQLRRLKLTYRLWDILNGLPAFLTGAVVELEGARLSIQLTGATPAGGEPGAGKGFQLPPDLPQVRMHDSFIELKGAGYETRFKGISLAAASARPGAFRLQLQVAQWSLLHPALRDIAVALEADMTYSNESLRIEKLLVDQQLLVKSAAIRLGGLPDDIPFEMRLSPAGGHLNADGRVAANGLQVALSGSDIDLSRISGLLAPPSVPFSGRLSLQGQLNLPFSDPRDMVSDLKIQLANGSVNETSVEQLAFRFTAGDRRLGLTDLQAANGANRMRISRASLAADVLYGSDLDAIWRSLAVDWQLEASDVPAVLRLFGLVLEGHDDRIPSHRLTLNGRLEGGDLIIPEGRLDAEGGHILLKDAHIGLPIGERTLKDSALAGDLNVDLPDVAVLSRIFTLPPLGGAVQGQIKVSGTMLAPQGAAGLSARALTYRNKALGNLKIQARGDLDGVLVQSAVLERGQDRANGRGTINLAEKSFENVSVGLSVSDVGPYFSDLLPLFRGPSEKTVSVGGGLKAEAKLAGSFSAPAGSLNLQARQVRVAGTPFGDADVDLKFSDEKLQVSSARLRNRNDRVDISGSIRLRQKLLEDVRLKVAISDLAAYRGPWLPALSDVSGSLQGRLQATGDLMLPEAAADLQVENLRFNDWQLEKASTKISSSGRVIIIESAAATLGQQQIQFAGDIRRNPAATEFGVTLKKLALIRRGSILLGLEREASFRLFRNGRMVFDNLDLVGSVGRVSVNGRFEPDGASNLLIGVADLKGDGWLDLLVADRLQFQGLNARIKIAGRPTAPSFAVEGILDNLGSPGVPMAFSGRFNLEYSQKVFKIHQFEWQGQKGQQIELTGALPLDPFGKHLFAEGQIALNGRTRISDAGVLGFILPWAASTGGSIQCDLSLSGAWTHPAGRLHLAVADLKRPVDIRPLPPGPYTINSDVRIDGDRVTLELLEASSAGWKIQAKGLWHGVPTLPDLVDPHARKPKGEVDLEGSLTVSDLSWIPPEVEGVRRLTGRLEARGTLLGPLTAPRAQATIKLSDAEFAPDFDMPSLRGLNLEAAVTPQAVNIRSLKGELGGAPFELTGSWQLAAGADAAADLRLRGKNILLYRTEGLRLRADTDLTLKGPLARLELSGEVAVTDGRYSKNFGLIEGITAAGKPNTGGGFRLFSIQKPPLRDMVFNVRLTAKEPFYIRNNLIRGSVRPDLVLTGTGEIPLLVGKVYVESTRLYLPAGRMQLETGLVRFEQADPDRPRLDLIGTATMLGYDITAVIDGPYDEPVITLSSIPPLPNEELLMLLLTGQPPKTGSVRSNSSRQGLNVAVFLGRDLISRLFGSDSDEINESILDRFDVQVGRAVTRQGEDTIDSQFRIADDVLMDGDSLYLTGERDYFDFYNGGIKLVIRFR